jgi:hypothetical protein
VSRMLHRLSVAAALLLATSAAWAQQGVSANGISSPIDGSAAAAPPPAPKTSSFETLSAGDRKIARALFLAQRPTADGPAPLSLNQIADLKARDSWARVFKQMQSQGLVRAGNLGQVVTAYEHQLHSDAEPRRVARNNVPSDSERSATLVTNGHGDVVASSRRAGAGMEHGGDVLGETGRSADMAAVPSKPERPGRPERPR